MNASARTLTTAGWYVLGRFHLPSQGVALLLLFACAQVAYGAAGGTPRMPAAALAVGAVSFVVLFLQMRLADDIDDHDPRRPLRDPDGRAIGRTWLTGAFAVAVGATAALNATWPAPLGCVLLVPALLLATPLVKRYVTDAWPVLAIGYETPPALILLYPELRRSAVAGRPPRVAAAVVIVVLLWGLYEFWKFARKWGEDTGQPYGLRPDGGRRALIALLALVTAGLFGAAVPTGHAAVLPWWPLALLLPLNALLALYIGRVSPAGRRHVTRLALGYPVLTAVIVIVGSLVR